MDEYQAFSGTAQLDAIKVRKDQNDLRPEDETFLTILALAELDFDKEFGRNGNNDDHTREQRQYDLSDGETLLNHKIENHWGQTRYHVQFRADGGKFMTFVKSANDKALLRLEERSKGFQWFFSFDLMLMHETRGRFKDSVILLDEPGLHLHPEGQQDLLKRLSEYAKDNTVIYTTHMPFMIDLREPDRLRVVNETASGTVVSEDLVKSEPAAKQVVETALAMGGRAAWRVAEQNLVVTSVDDYWILTELSYLFRKSARDGLPPDVLITPAGGPVEAANIAAYMLAHQLDVVALFDSDLAGRTARDKLAKAWQPKFPKQTVGTLDLAEAIASPGLESTIEDLFPVTFYVPRLQKAYENQLPPSALNFSTLPFANSLVKRIETVLRSANVVFNRRLVNKRIVADIRQMKSLMDLPEPTRRMGERLFAHIKKAFTKR